MACTIRKYGFKPNGSCRYTLLKEGVFSEALGCDPDVTMSIPKSCRGKAANDGYFGVRCAGAETNEGRDVSDLAR